MEADHEQLRRELERLREQLAALARGQEVQIGRLRAAFDALERQLHPPVAEEPPALPTAFQQPVAEISPREEAVAPPAVEAGPVPPPMPASSFELRFGRVWLVRLGIALLVTGLVLLGNYAYQNWIRDLPAGVRLAALYGGSLLLCGSGVHVARRETMRRFGEVLLAGGLAFFYWCTFAAHHVARLRVVDSPVAAGVLLLAAAAVMVAVSLRRDSRGTAALGLLLASYSTVLQPLGWLSAVSNVVLAAAGVALTRRPGWAAPGIASMAGTYAAFLGWQLAGGWGGRPEDPAALWFLPPVWAVFALPGVVGISRHFGGLGERARMGFAAANNIAFFLLFSGLWWQQRGGADYWTVPAVFGAVLLALGAPGRSRNAAGGVHLAQGLGALTLAMALKLDGYHLALGFAGQALSLGLVFRRFGGKSELGFAVLATALAVYAALVPAGLESDVPLWSRALVAGLLVAAAFPLRSGCDRFETGSEMGNNARVSATFVLLAGSALMWVICVFHLGEEWRAPACGAVSLGLSVFTLKFDPRRRLFEAGWMAAGFGLTCLPMMFQEETLPPWWSPAIAGALGLAGHALWVKRDPSPADPRDPPPSMIVWLTAAIVTVGVCNMLLTLHLSPPGHVLSFAAATVILAALGRFVLPSRPLQVAAALLLPQALSGQLQLGADVELLQFLPAMAALGVVALAGPRTPAGILARIAAGLSWLLAWREIAPHAWGDVVAAGGVILAVTTVRRSGRILPETWAFLTVAGLWILSRSVLVPWRQLDPPPWPYGSFVVMSGLATLLLMPAPDARLKGIRHGLLLGACALLALWSTQEVVWHFGWKPVAILWTILGFSLVSSGLWRKLAALRHAGFALLAISLVKLFAIDVWDFGAFTRVAAFLALGMALVVLGFFYNRFAEVLKKILEGDEE